MIDTARFNTKMTRALKRELRNAVRIVTKPHLFSESLIEMSWKMLKQHGVPK